jgi:hypothetical protein
MKIPQMKRVYLIIEMLNDLKPHKTKDIQAKINYKMDSNYCKSQIEKDLYWVKWNLDMDDYEAGAEGIRIFKKIDFFERLKNYLQ